MIVFIPTRPPGRRADQSFLLRRAQPAMTGLIDGSLSTLAPVFAVALATHQPHYAFFAGLDTVAHLQHRLPAVVRVDRHRRRDHRRCQRRARRPQLISAL